MKVLMHNEQIKEWNLNDEKFWDYCWTDRYDNNRKWPFYSRKEIYAEILPKFKDGDSILDIGCGDGGLFYYITEKYKDTKLYGVDIGNFSLDIAKKNIGDKAAFKKIKDFYDIDFGIKFDTITLIEVIEHLENPIPYIMFAINLLKKGGKIIITTPNINFSYEQKHLYAFEEDDFTTIFKKYFSNIDVKAIDLKIRKQCTIIAVGENYIYES